MSLASPALLGTPFPRGAAGSRVDAEIFGLGHRFLSDIVVAVPGEGPRHAEADEFAAEIHAIGAAQGDCSAVAIGRAGLTGDGLAPGQVLQRGAGLNAGRVVFAPLLGFRGVDTPKAIGGAAQLERVAINDRLGKGLGGDLPGNVLDGPDPKSPGQKRHERRRDQSTDAGRQTLPDTAYGVGLGAQPCRKEGEPEQQREASNPIAGDALGVRRARRDKGLNVGFQAVRRAQRLVRDGGRKGWAREQFGPARAGALEQSVGPSERVEGLPVVIASGHFEQLRKPLPVDARNGGIPFCPKATCPNRMAVARQSARRRQRV